MEFLNNIFDISNFMPHGHCYLWRKSILYTHLFSDALIALSYFSIPIALIFFVKKRKDIPMNHIFFMFAGFILFCGVTHLFAIYTIFTPAYQIEGVLKVATAAISVITAIVIWFLIPKLLLIPSLAEVKEKNKELKNLNQELQKFAYVTTHDLREPLRKIETFAAMLGEEDAEKDKNNFKNLLGKISKSSARLNQFVNDLSEYVRTSSDQVSTSHNVNIESIIKGLMQEFDQRIKKYDATIHVKSLKNIYANELDLKILVRNLLENALKYRDDDKKTEISIWTTESKKHIKIHVKDNGIGIPKNKKDVIFEPFQRLHNQTQFKGSGIGLAICYKIVSKYNGEIAVKSSVEKGSEFIASFLKKEFYES